MEYPVIVRAEEVDGYVAQPIGLPELRVTAASEDEAIAGVRQALERWLATAKVVHVSGGVEKTGQVGAAQRRCVQPEEHFPGVDMLDLYDPPARR